MTDPRGVDTPYAVRCPKHGKVCLSTHEYSWQLSRPDDLWRCPICGQASEWDDTHYEAVMGPDGPLTDLGQE